MVTLTRMPIANPTTAPTAIAAPTLISHRTSPGLGERPQGHGMSCLLQIHPRAHPSRALYAKERSRGLQAQCLGAQSGKPLKRWGGM